MKVCARLAIRHPMIPPPETVRVSQRRVACDGATDIPGSEVLEFDEAEAKKVRDSVVAKVPLKVASTADDIAQLVCFLAMPASSNMTGEVVRMDAGMHLIT